MTPAATGNATADEACPDPANLPLTPWRDMRGSVHERAAVCAAWYGLARGRRAHAYAPGRDVRRDQMASLLDRLRRAAGVVIPVDARTVHYDDIDGNTHEGAIIAMARLDVLIGNASGQFQPGRAARRQDVAVGLARVAALAGVAVSGAPNAFPDDDGDPDESWINAAAQLGIVAGRADGTLDGGAAVRRDQAASMLARTVAVMVGNNRLRARPIPGFQAKRAGLDRATREAMRGSSWRAGCPVALDDLVSVRVRRWGYDARPGWGRLIVARAVAADVIAVFGVLYEQRFQMQRMRPVHRYGGDDGASMAANNTSAFNCRAVTGGSGWSQHSYGTAIDINPRQNPYVKDGTVLPSNARPWLRRQPVRTGMIVADGPVVRAFTDIGWGWGGSYVTLKDYQHFSQTGG